MQLPTLRHAPTPAVPSLRTLSHLLPRPRLKATDLSKSLGAGPICNSGTGVGRLGWFASCRAFTTCPPAPGASLGAETSQFRGGATCYTARWRPTLNSRTAGSLGDAFRGAFAGRDKSGPFDQEGFRREYWRSTMGHGGRKMPQGSYSHRLECLHAPGARAEHRRRRAGVVYFLTSQGPHASPQYQATSLQQRPPPSTPSRNPQNPSLYSPDRLPQSVLSRRPVLDHFHHAFTRPGPAVARLLPSRPFSTGHSTSRRYPLPPPGAHLEAGFPILLPLMAALKSTAALNVISLLSRAALTLLPLSLRSKFLHVIRQRYAEDPNASGWVKSIVEREGRAGRPSGAVSHFNARFIFPLLLLLPVALLGVSIVASLERTPLTGRQRIVMLSPTEEAELVDSILAQGETPALTHGRDWVAILRAVLELGDEGRSPTTGRRILLGGEVLDERDWRLRWTEAVLRALEAAVPGLATAGAVSTTSDGVLSPPPTSYPLHPRSTTSSLHTTGAEGPLPTGLVANYDLLVIEKAEANAFSMGFGPAVAAGGGRGVIVVYTGFLDEILGRSPVVSTPAPPLPRSDFASFFANLLPARAQPLPNLTPTTLPSAEQTQACAVLLSHELAHLLLSHTLESYASTALLVPHLSKMASDVARVLFFPFTAMLGPFFNDAIGQSINEGARGGFGFLGRACNSCQSRKLEEEADVVALRILANSGIDPHRAIDFWAARLSATVDGATVMRDASRVQMQSAVDGTTDKACIFLRTHPPSDERVAKIQEELERWKVYNGLHRTG